MGRMKEVWQLKQDLIEQDPALTDMPDTYFMDVYLAMRRCEEGKEDKPESELDAWDGDETDKIQY